MSLSQKTEGRYNCIDTWTAKTHKQVSKLTDHLDQKLITEESDLALYVIPEHYGKVICKCPNPDLAEWIAKRLNLAAEFEENLEDQQDITCVHWRRC